MREAEHDQERERLEGWRKLRQQESRLQIGDACLRKRDKLKDREREYRERQRQRGRSKTERKNVRVKLRGNL